MKKIVIEEKVEVLMKRTRLVPDDLTDSQIKELHSNGDLDSFDCEDVDVMLETEELLTPEENNVYHTVKIYNEQKETIFINGAE